MQKVYGDNFATQWEVKQDQNETGSKTEQGNRRNVTQETPKDTKHNRKLTESNCN